MTDNDTLLPSDPYNMPEDASVDDTYFEARCAPVHDLLLEGLSAAHGGDATGKPLRIDVLSVDAEGAEIEIFKDCSSGEGRCLCPSQHGKVFAGGWLGVPRED